VVGDWTDEQRSIGIETADACTFLDHPLDDAEITDRLGRYGFVVTGSAGKLSVRVPPHRVWDVEFTADLYEELAKSIGYNNTATNLPDVDMGALPSAAEAMKARVEDVLLGAGMYEVFTNGFHGTDMRDRLGLEPTHVLSSYVQTTNALDRGYGLIKNNGLAQAVEAVATNTRAGTRPISMYEWTRTFHLDASASNGVCSERHLLWAIAAGSTEIDRWSDTARQASPWFFKGLVEEIATTLQLPISVGPADSAHPLSDCMHPGRCAAIQLGCKTVGILGEVHPRIVSAFKLKRTRPVYMEIDREALKTTSTRTRYAERSVHQPIMRSLAFSLPTKITAGEVAETLRTHGPDWLEAVDIVDLFKHEEDGSPMRAITFALRYSNAQGDRSAEAVNAASEALISAIESAFGAQGVKLRA
jgi:phenylalanyl-tRNA synthetase beta chain